MWVELRAVQEVFRVVLMFNYYFKVSLQHFKSFQTCLPKKKPKLNSEEKKNQQNHAGFIFFEMPNYFPISRLKLHILNSL